MRWRRRWALSAKVGKFLENLCAIRKSFDCEATRALAEHYNIISSFLKHKNCKSLKVEVGCFFSVPKLEKFPKALVSSPCDLRPEMRIFGCYCPLRTTKSDQHPFTVPRETLNFAFSCSFALSHATQSHFLFTGTQSVVAQSLIESHDLV